MKCFFNTISDMGYRFVQNQGLFPVYPLGKATHDKKYYCS